MGAPQAQAQGQVSAQHTCGCRGGLWPGLTSGGACRAKSAGACCRLCQSLRAPGLGPACSVCPLQTPCVSWLSLTELPFPSHTPRPIQPPPSLQSFPTPAPRLHCSEAKGPIWGLGTHLRGGVGGVWLQGPSSWGVCNSCRLPPLSPLILSDATQLTRLPPRRGLGQAPPARRP